MTTAIQEGQNLNMTNSALDPADKATFCNYATQNILKTVASATDNSDGLVITGKANQMVPKMEGSSLLIGTDKSTAEANAKSGGLSILGYINPKLNDDGTEKHGHVATFSVGENVAKGEVANIGSHNGFQGVSAQDGDPHIFSQNAAAQVKYFTLSPTVTPKQAPQYVPIGKYPQQQNNY